MGDLQIGVGKYWAKIRDVDLLGLFVLFVFLVSVGTAYLVYADTIKSQYDRDKMMANQEQIKRAIEATAEAQRETTYMLSLSQEKREKMNLQMPDSLRKRIGNF